MSLTAFGATSRMALDDRFQGVWEEAEGAHDRRC